MARGMDRAAGELSSPTAGALRQARLDARRLERRQPSAWQRNLDLHLQAWIVTEAVMMGLAPQARTPGLHMTSSTTPAAPSAEAGGALARFALRSMPEVSLHLDRSSTQCLLDPRNYLGSAAQMVDLSLR